MQYASANLRYSILRVALARDHLRGSADIEVVETPTCFAMSPRSRAWSGNRNGRDDGDAHYGHIQCIQVCS